MENENIPNEIVKLPLWKNCLERMVDEGVEYGKTYTAEFFEEQLRCSRDSMTFGLGVSEIRRCLEEQGFYLSGRGQKGNSFIILPPESNKDVMAAYQRQAIDALKRGVILGTNTRLDTLGAEERRKHESVLEKMAVRMALMGRSNAIYKAVQKHSPKLLEKG